MTYRSIALAFSRAFIIAVTVFAAGCASTSYGPGVDIHAILSTEDRMDSDRVIDLRRKSPQLYGYTGVRSGMKVLDIGAGGGYTTELMQRIVGPTGTVYSHDAPDQMQRIKDNYNIRAKRQIMQRVVRLERPYDDPVSPDVSDIDVVTFFFSYHDMVHMGVDRAKMNRRIFAALKPGGVYVVADHSARPGDGANVTKTLHRIDEAFVRREIESVGFQFVGEGGFLRNPEDPRTESVFKPKVPNDEFVLKFRKPG